MIDKLDLRVPGSAQFTPRFGKLYADLRHDPKRWRESKTFAASASFEDCGYPVLLHMHCTLTKEPIHKLEFLETGKRTYGEMMTLASSVFAVDPERLGVMRVDLTADVEGVPVDWFKRHTLVSHKQIRREHGVVEQPYLTIRQGRAETLYAGKKPNQIRIYDKTGERVRQYRRQIAELKRNGFPADALASFETLYGQSPLTTVTRVERQCAHRDLDKLGIAQARDLTKADLLDPFDRMIFFESSLRDPTLVEWGFRDYCAGMHLRQRVQEHGIGETLAWMKAHFAGSRNFDRERKKFAPFLLLPSTNVVSIDAARLRKIYADSTTRQLLRRAA